MTGTPLAILGPAAVVVLSALAALLRPAWVFTLVLVAIPVRVPVFPTVELVTLILLGAVLGRAPAIVAALRDEPRLFVATLALPAWFLASGLWAQQSSFVYGAAGKWMMLWLAMTLVVADDTLRPRRIVLSALLAMVPVALWGAAERLRLVMPMGDERILRNRAIDLEFMVRGRALFWHPNRLAEYLEQIGLLLVGCGISGLAPVLCASGVVIAVAGIWGSDSKAGMATLVGGALITIAWLQMSSTARRRALWLGVVGFAGAVAVGVWAYRAHGGIGTRVLVYRYAWQLVQTHPLLGIGGGNWPLAIAAAPLGVSRFWFRTHAHSLPLQLAVEVGLIGVLLGGLLFAAPLWLAWRRLHASSPAWQGVVHGAMAGVLGILAHNLVHYFLRDAADGILTGLLLGLAVAGAGRREDATGAAPPAATAHT